MMSAETRYRDDNQFRALVDKMEHMVQDLQFTPSEMRDAAMLACLHFEMRRPFPFPNMTPRDTQHPPLERI